MRKRIKRAQRKAVAGAQELSIRTIPDHPGNSKRVPRRKVERALHGDGNGPAGAKDRQLPAPAARGDELRQTAVHASAKFGPGFYIVEGDLSIHPLGDHHLEQFLEMFAPLAGTARGLISPMVLTNCAVALDESRKAALQHRVALVFVEFLHDNRLRKLQAGIPIGFEHDSGRFPLTDARPGANAVENNVVPYPILAQQAGLGFPGCRELVVVWFREGSLPVAHQENAAHVARSNRPAAPWPPPMHMVTTP